jgi:hypothetical protein
MLTCRVYGLTDWDTAETSEDVTLDGQSNVATSNSYVIIHRIKGLTFGSGGTNAGIITATAVTDGTVTAAIQAGEGQTLMAIYGVPSTQSLHITHIYTTVLKNVTNVMSDGVLLVKEDADVATSAFITKERWQFSRDGPFSRPYDVAKSVSGPAIVKVQVNTNANDTVVTAAFDGYLVTT